tara:strand:+ start:1604 stop:1882 length:279 start_codon:yes stop_codon:yes gene_type:complete
MAFKMAGYSYPGKSPKPQKNFDEKLKNIEKETDEERREREDLNQQIFVDAINRESKKKKSPKPQKNDDKTIEEKREASLTSAIGKYNKSKSE